MVNPEDHRSKSARDHITKKCHNCFTYLPLHAKVCTSCHKKVGEVDKLGFAKKPFDWRAYLLAVLSMTAFAVFLWWAFFQE
jgi:hypothetical protein